MNIAIIGATGMVGSRVVAEAARRGHEVIAASRSGSPVSGASRAIALGLNDTAKVLALINASEATVISIPPDRKGGSHEPILQAHRDLIAAKPSGRFLVVGGAGALEIDGGTTQGQTGISAGLSRRSDDVFNGTRPVPRN